MAPSQMSLECAARARFADLWTFESGEKARTANTSYHVMSRHYHQIIQLPNDPNDPNGSGKSLAFSPVSFVPATKSLSLTVLELQQRTAHLNWRG